MNDINKIVQIFQSGNYQLAIQLAAGIGMNDVELLMYIWENESEYYDITPEEYDMYLTHQRCIFGEFELTKEYDVDINEYEWFLADDYGNDSYYSTLHNALTCILNIIELNQNRVN